MKDIELNGRGPGTFYVEQPGRQSIAGEMEADLCSEAGASLWAFCQDAVAHRPGSTYVIYNSDDQITGLPFAGWDADFERDRISAYFGSRPPIGYWRDREADDE